jgi:hypothetical protein
MTGDDQMASVPSVGGQRLSDGSNGHFLDTHRVTLDSSASSLIHVFDSPNPAQPTKERPGSMVSHSRQEVSDEGKLAQD